MGFEHQLSARLSILKERNKFSQKPIHKNKEIILSHTLTFFSSPKLECYAALWHNNKSNEALPFLLFLPTSMKVTPQVLGELTQGHMLFFNVHWASSVPRTLFRKLLPLYHSFTRNPHEVKSMERGLLFYGEKICPTFCDPTGKINLNIE